MIEIAAILAGLWVLLGAIWLAVWPIVGGRPAAETDGSARLREREVELDRLVGELHEVELDRATGKLSEADGRAIEARLRARAVEVLREIDRLRGVEVEAEGRVDAAIGERIAATSGRSSG